MLLLPGRQTVIERLAKALYQHLALCLGQLLAGGLLHELIQGGLHVKGHDGGRALPEQPATQRQVEQQQGGQGGREPGKGALGVPGGYGCHASSTSISSGKRSNASS